jgi:hypothetical protein
VCCLFFSGCFLGIRGVLISVFGLGCSFLTIAVSFSSARFARQRMLRFSLRLADDSRDPLRSLWLRRSNIVSLAREHKPCPWISFCLSDLRSPRPISGRVPSPRFASVFIVFLLSSPLRLGSLHPAFLFARRSAPQFFVRFFLQSFSAVSAQECAPGSVSLARFQGAQKVLRFPRTGSGSYSVSGPRSPVRPSFRFRPDSVLVFLRSAVATTSFCFLFLPPEEQPAINFVRKWSYS